ncbi:hypothetical protein ACIPIN_14020 [Pseudomonas sp. NPDC087697]|uniref:hypothetical protein n=1 Tax=Pseudomonas sp. NPDC087697 TaxID=3364447 RepID=UPI003826DE21
MSALAIDYQPLTTIKLYGALRQFGREFRLSVRTPAEAVKALCVQIPGFERFISNAKSRGLEFAVFRGSKNLEEKELGYGGAGEIRIAPIVTGSKRAGIIQTVVGTVLIAAGYLLAGPTGGASLSLGADHYRSWFNTANTELTTAKAGRDNPEALAGEQGRKLGELVRAGELRERNAALAQAQAREGAQPDYTAANRLLRERTGGDPVEAAASIIDQELGL